jgi:Domain of unknown function (DUF4331)
LTFSGVDRQPLLSSWCGPGQCASISRNAPDTVTIIANYIPLESPAGGPNFPAFDETVLYEIHVDNNGDAKEDLTYQFRFHIKRTAIAS